jgi:WD40 repeat protein
MGGNDGLVWVWDASEGEVATRLEGHSAPVWSVAWSPDGALVAAAAGDLSGAQAGENAVRLWQVEDEELVATFGELLAPAVSVSWSPAGDQLAAVSPDGTVRVWTLPASE